MANTTTSTPTPTNALTLARWAGRRLTVEWRINRSLAAFLGCQNPGAPASDHQRPSHRHIQLTHTLSR